MSFRFQQSRREPSDDELPTRPDDFTPPERIHETPALPTIPDLPLPSDPIDEESPPPPPFRRAA